MTGSSSRLVSASTLAMAVVAGLAIQAYSEYNSDASRIRRQVHQALKGSENHNKAEMWNEALALAQTSKTATPIVKFHLAFAVACALDEDVNKTKEAEIAFKKALRMLELGDDLHELRMDTRVRVATVLDRLAGKAQDRGEKKEALGFYVRALDAIGTQKDIQDVEFGKFPPSLVQHSARCLAFSGILNNLSTLLGDESFQSRAVQLKEACASSPEAEMQN